MSGTCHTQGKERGAWYEIQCVRNDIVRKEASGEDATFERKLLESWSKHRGWLGAGKPIGKPLATRKKSKSRGIKLVMNTKGRARKKRGQVSRRGNKRDKK